MRWKRLFIGLPVLLIAVPAIYFLASMIGAYISGTINQDSTGTPSQNDKEIYLLTSLLHADIAIPVDAKVLQKFSFLKQSGIEMEHSGLKFLVFGWGSRAFYTTAGTYADITVSATVKAITSDTAVIHVVPAGQLTKNESSIAIKVTEQGFSRLLNFLYRSFENDITDTPTWLQNVSHGYGDVFYLSNGNFNILNPCNVWTGNALKHAGVPVGAWTPTTQSLKWSLDYHRQ